MHICEFIIIRGHKYKQSLIKYWLNSLYKQRQNTEWEKSYRNNKKSSISKIKIV